MLNYENLNAKQKEYVDTCSSMFGNTEITKSQIKQVNKKLKMKSSPAWLIKDPAFRLARGVYKLPVQGQSISVPEVKAVEEVKTAKVSMTSNKAENVVPTKDQTFVPWGHYKDIKSVIKAGMFYPTFITGLSGNGKTLNVLQSCAELNRECIRVNVTIETDEDDLLGGFRLVNGETAWHDGPVVDAMKRGAVLLLDEIDLASNKIMCLQPILEGKGVFLKKINEYVEPAKGFNIVATANTKGKGSEDGRFIGTNVLNEAFLERFPITFEQSYPSMKIETNIVLKVFQDLKINDKKFAENLVKWADVIRKTFYDGGIDEIISTRRIVHIANAYAIFKNKMKAIQVCTNRFDEDTKNSFLDLYTKVDAGEDLSQLNAETETDSNDSEEGGPIDND
jgi:midasin (ATPase involved in ribosome maturation)|tara:strand:+ start:7795 stop:8973 length:1179 start_codon:yes stop_codon:yes gene_type:complete